MQQCKSTYIWLVTLTFRDSSLAFARLAMKVAPAAAVLNVLELTSTCRKAAQVPAVPAAWKVLAAIASPLQLQAEHLNVVRLFMLVGQGIDATKDTADIHTQ
jgi:hypothetical protein